MTVSFTVIIVYNIIDSILYQYTCVTVSESASAIVSPITRELKDIYTLFWLSIFIINFSKIFYIRLLLFVVWVAGKKGIFVKHSFRIDSSYFFD